MWYSKSSNQTALFFTIVSCALIATSHSSATMVERKKFFTDIMGIDETTFNGNNNNAIANAITFGAPSKDPFLSGHTALATAYIHKLDPKTLKATDTKFQAGYFEEMSIKELRDATKIMTPGGGIFNVVEAIDPHKNDDVLKKVDSGALQALAQNKDAVFQIASNFNGLEFVGPKGHQVHNLTSYLRDNTQGPFASISGFPGLVLRDYYVFHTATTADTPGSPTQAQLALAKNPYIWGQSKDDKKTNTNNGQINFLDQTNIPVKQGYVILDNTTINNPEDEIEKMKIGYHGNLQVTFGFKEYSGKHHEKVDDTTQIINQVFTAAMDTTRNANTPENKKVAQAILRAAYEGTLRAALFKGKKNVILTLIGGGVFENDIRWIANVIKDLENLIISSGLNVTLIVFNSAGYDQTMWKGAETTLLDVVKATGGTLMRYSQQKPEGTVLYEPPHSGTLVHQFASGLHDIAG